MRNSVFVLLLCMLFTSCVIKNTMKTAREYQRPIEATKKIKDFKTVDYAKSRDVVWDACISTLNFYEANIIREFKNENKLIGKIKGDFIVIWVENSDVKEGNTKVSVKVLPRIATYLVLNVDEVMIHEKISEFSH